MRKLILVVTLTFFCALMFGHILAEATGRTQKDVTASKFYTSICLEEGDTLWSIAERYADSDIISCSDYVKELMAMNGLSSDKIHAGKYLAIFYYASEPD